jgi:hypothetical protein
LTRARFVPGPPAMPSLWRNGVSQTSLQVFNIIRIVQSRFYFPIGTSSYKGSKRKLIVGYHRKRGGEERIAAKSASFVNWYSLASRPGPFNHHPQDFPAWVWATVSSIGRSQKAGPIMGFRAISSQGQMYAANLVNTSQPPFCSLGYYWKFVFTSPQIRKQ